MTLVKIGGGCQGPNDEATEGRGTSGGTGSLALRMALDPALSLRVLIPSAASALSAVTCPLASRVSWRRIVPERLPPVTCPMPPAHHLPPISASRQQTRCPAAALPDPVLFSKDGRRGRWPLRASCGGGNAPAKMPNEPGPPRAAESTLNPEPAAAVRR